MKEIFICIYCFFIRKNKDCVLKILNDHHCDSAKGIEKLHGLCLVIVDKEGNLIMHDMFQDMGWEIVLAESSGNLEERSRLRVPEDVEGVLRNNSASNSQSNSVKFLCTIKEKYMHIFIL